MAVRETFGALGSGSSVSERRRRTLEYRFSALDGGYESVCSECEDTLRGAVEPPSGGTSTKGVVVEK
jgi:hypothetical protein